MSLCHLHTCRAWDSSSVLGSPLQCMSMKKFLIPNMQQALEVLTPCRLPSGRGTALLIASDVSCVVLQADTGGGRVPEFAEIHLQALCLEHSSPRESKMLFSMGLFPPPLCSLCFQQAEPSTCAELGAGQGPIPDPWSSPAFSPAVFSLARLPQQHQAIKQAWRGEVHAVWFGGIRPLAE